MQDPVPLPYVPAAHGMQVTVRNRPLAWHVAVPPPLWPGAHVTDTVDPVEPVMLPVAAYFFEFATCVAVHALGEHATVVN